MVYKVIERVIVSVSKMVYKWVRGGPRGGFSPYKRGLSSPPPLPGQFFIYNEEDPLILVNASKDYRERFRNLYFCYKVTTQNAFCRDEETKSK